MTVEDFLKMFGINPDDDDELACIIQNNSDSSVFYTEGANKPVIPGQCKCCVYEHDTEAEECANGGCRDGIIEWLNLKHDDPIPVVCKPFVYKGFIIDSFSLDYYGEKTYLVLYDDDESIIDRIPFSEEEQGKMFDTVGGSPAWQWNYLVDMFGDKDNNVTIITETEE